jgi:hypothetical protein
MTPSILRISRAATVPESEIVIRFYTKTLRDNGVKTVDPITMLPATREGLFKNTVMGLEFCAASECSDIESHTPLVGRMGEDGKFLWYVVLGSSACWAYISDEDIITRDLIVLRLNS